MPVFPKIGGAEVEEEVVFVVAQQGQNQSKVPCDV